VVNSIQSPCEFDICAFRCDSDLGSLVGHMHLGDARGLLDVQLGPEQLMGGKTDGWMS
jgi:hypothetical protein